MSYTEDYIKLTQAIAQNEQETNKLYNLFSKSNGELGLALSFNPQLSHTELKFLKMATDAIEDASNLIINLRTETHNKNTLIKGLDETFGETLEIMKEQDSLVKVSKEYRDSGTKATQNKAELWQDYINRFVAEYIELHPYYFDREECSRFRELKNFVENKILNFSPDEKLRNTSGKNKGTFTPPDPNKKKLSEAIKHFFSNKTEKD
tara:strand:- start:1665 stop:2285 length:621 start_codon:yes stop_codon:yes gene_type:complete